MAELIRAYEGNKPYIFVSYSHRDSNIVLSYIEKLYELKYRVWYDEGIAPGSEWPKNIEDHLKGCECVLIFVSKDSLVSINCENEVKSALELGKEIIEVSLDGNTHPKINNNYLIEKDNLLSSINEKYIGDGTGYDRDIKKGKHSVLWVILIGFAIALIISIGVGLYGINAGWFDSYLPALQPIENEEVEEIKQEVEISDSGLANILANVLERDDLTQELQFTSEESKNRFYQMFNWDPEIPVNYNDLKQNNCDYLRFDYFYNDYLDLLPYLSNLKTIEIIECEMKDFTKLSYCKTLEEVKVNYSIFPIELPKKYNFSFTVFKN